MQICLNCRCRSGRPTGSKANDGKNRGFESSIRFHFIDGPYANLTYSLSGYAEIGGDGLHIFAATTAEPPQSRYDKRISFWGNSIQRRLKVLFQRSAGQPPYAHLSCLLRRETREQATPDFAGFLFRRERVRVVGYRSVGLGEFSQESPGSTHFRRPDGNLDLITDLQIVFVPAISGHR